jgi:hypothetical protein
MTGVSLSSAFVPGFLSGCTPEKTGTVYTPGLLNKDQYQFLQSISDILIPPTETPGAVELGVPELLETIAYKCYTKDQQQHFKQYIQHIMVALGTNKSFISLDLSSQQEAVKEFEEGLHSSFSNLKDSYMEIKGSIASAYLNTKYVGTELLEYLPVPGPYEPCIPISKTNGKAYTYG